MLYDYFDIVSLVNANTYLFIYYAQQYPTI